MAPGEQYTGDREIADAGGRYLGYAAITALESMLPPKRGLGFEGVVESGAPLAVWRQRTFEPSTVITAERFDVPLLLRPELPTVAEFERDYAAAEDRTIKERFRRKLFILRGLGDGPPVPVAANVWRIGDMVLVGQPCEAYSDFQIQLRKAFPRASLFVMNLVNGTLGYLPPTARYGDDIYQVWQTPFAPGCLETMTHHCTEQVGKALGDGAA